MRGISVEFHDRDYQYGFMIYSHYTTILGLNSGEGKTWMFDTLSERYNEGIIAIKAEYSVIFADTVNLLNLLEVGERSIIFVDEIAINKNSMYLGKINSSKHFIVAISRSVPFRAGSPLNGIYKVVITKDMQFAMEKMNRYNDLRLAENLDHIDIIVTEAVEGRSEHSYITKCKEEYHLQCEVVAAGGKDRIASVLRRLSLGEPEKRILVLMDLANVSSQYKLLTKRCRDNQNIVFYHYACFEELLCQSRLVSSLNRICDADPFAFYSLERYYEYALEEKTLGSAIEYTHKHPCVSDCYVSECRGCGLACSLACEDKAAQVLDSDVGKLLYTWIKKQSLGIAKK